jgi:hypothetical protein
MSKPQTWQAVQDGLTARRAALNEEIAAYPGPITGCDAQFNHLLELRTSINADLKRLGELSEGADAGTLEHFIASCPSLAGKSGEKQQ